jgi:hypothetical protein
MYRSTIHKGDNRNFLVTSNLQDNQTQRQRSGQGVDCRKPFFLPGFAPSSPVILCTCAAMRRPAPAFRLAVWAWSRGGGGVDCVDERARAAKPKRCVRVQVPRRQTKRVASSDHKSIVTSCDLLDIIRACTYSSNGPLCWA